MLDGQGGGRGGSIAVYGSPLPRAPRRSLERGLDVHQAALGRDARRAHTGRRGAHLPRRRDSTPIDLDTRGGRARSRRHQRQLEDRRARLRDRRRIPRARQPGRPRRHPRDGAARGGPRCTPTPSSAGRRSGSGRRSSATPARGGSVSPKARSLLRRARLQARRVPSRSSACRTRGATSCKSFTTCPSTSCRRRAAAPSRASSAASRRTTGRSSASAPCGRSSPSSRTCGPRILFGDDNVMIHTKYSHELFEAMVPLGKHWVAQASLAALHRVENVEVMARAGCRALFIGFESVDDEAVRNAGKRQNKPQQVRRGRAMPRRPRDRRLGELHLRPRRRLAATPSSARSTSASTPRSRWRSSRCSRPIPARRSTSA